MTTGAQIAQDAREGVTAGWTTDLLGYCSRFVRQVAQHAGIKGDLFGGTAIETGQKMRAAGVVSDDTSTMQAGDVLLQEFGSHGDGHIGIFLGNGQVAENGYHGKRIISVAQFGRITGVARLADSLGPDPYGTYAAGGLPTPFTGSGSRPFAVSSGAAHVDARSGLQKKWDGFTEAIDPRQGISNGIDGALGKVGEWFTGLWAKVAPYLASIGLGVVALLILVLGAWAAIEGGK